MEAESGSPASVWTQKPPINIQARVDDHHQVAPNLNRVWDEFWIWTWNWTSKNSVHVLLFFLFIFLFPFIILFVFITPLLHLLLLAWKYSFYFKYFTSYSKNSICILYWSIFLCSPSPIYKDLKLPLPSSMLCFLSILVLLAFGSSRLDDLAVLNQCLLTSLLIISSCFTPCFEFNYIFSEVRQISSFFSNRCQW